MSTCLNLILATLAILAVLARGSAIGRLGLRGLGRTLRSDQLFLEFSVAGVASLPRASMTAKLGSLVGWLDWLVPGNSVVTLGAYARVN